VESLATILGSQGYYTAALSDWCGADMGKFTLGFDHVDVPADQWNIKYFLRQGPKELRLLLSLFARNRFGKRFLPEIYHLGGVPLTDELGRDARRLINDLARCDQPFYLNLFFSTTHGPFGSEHPYYTRYADPGYAGESKFVMARLTDPFDIIRRQGEPKEEFDLDQIINLYDGCVTRFDDEVKHLMTHIEQCGLAENTLVVIYADHGMEFFEHDTWGQGNSVISEVSNRIPLLICGPNVPHMGIVRDPVRSIDLMPTLEELCGINSERGTDGISLMPYLRDPSARMELDVFSETGVWLTDLPGSPSGHLSYPSLMELLTVRNKISGTISLKPEYERLIIRAKDRMIRRGCWKLVCQPLQDGKLIKLFNIANDPGCIVDVSAQHPDVVSDLSNRLTNWINSDPTMAHMEPRS
jgi:arylsulfatase A-like enzyme